MATGTFTYDTLRTKTLTERSYKNTKKDCKSFKLNKSNAFFHILGPFIFMSWGAGGICGGACEKKMAIEGGHP